jgi:hypothetical protein
MTHRATRFESTVDGTPGVPAFGFKNEIGLGLRRSAAGELTASVGSADIVTIDANQILNRKPYALTVDTGPAAQPAGQVAVFTDTSNKLFFMGEDDIKREVKGTVIITGSTTNATPLVVYTQVTSNSQVTSIEVNINVLRDDDTEGGSFKIKRAYRSTGGVATPISSLIKDAFRDDPLFDVTITSTGLNLSVNVVGVAGKNLNWRGTVDIFATL